jgi:8-oxo-dGTP pyrophosphatase MutT (NUDIX family)
VRPEDALARLPVPLRRVAYRVGYRLLQLWSRLRPVPGQGVKCVLRHEGRILFIRHTYGARELWELPGGGLHRDEPPLDAAAREAREELGVDLAWRRLASIDLRDHRLTTMHVFTAEAESDVVTADPGELAEVLWAAPQAPPRPLSVSAAAILRLPGVAAPPG